MSRTRRLRMNLFTPHIHHSIFIYLTCNSLKYSSRLIVILQQINTRKTDIPTLLLLTCSFSGLSQWTSSQFMYIDPDHNLMKQFCRQGMHVMYTEPPAQYRSSQPQSTQSEYQPAVSPARQQPAKKRRVLSPAAHTPQQQTQPDSAGYKVSTLITQTLVMARLRLATMVLVP